MEPDILLIDEVLAVGDAGFRFKCINKMAELMNRTAVIFVSHSMPQILRVSNRVMYLEGGRVAYEGEDISKGVDAYYEVFGKHSQTIIGSGDVALEMITARSGDQKASPGIPLELEHGSSLELTMTLMMGPEIRHAVIQVLFWNMELLPVLNVLGPNLQGYSVVNEPGTSNEITVKIDNLSLNSGMHYISVIVTSPGFSKQYLQQDNAAVVRMLSRTPSGSGAQSVIAGQWSDEVEPH